MSKSLKEVVDEKMNELSMAHYSGDISGMVVIFVTKAGVLQTMRAYDSNQAPHIYMASSLLQREIEQIIQSSATKPQERN